MLATGAPAAGRPRECRTLILQERPRRRGLGGGLSKLQPSSPTPAPGWPHSPCLRPPPAPGWPEPPRKHRQPRRGCRGSWGPRPCRDGRASPAPGSPRPLAPTHAGMHGYATLAALAGPRLALERGSEAGGAEGRRDDRASRLGSTVREHSRWPGCGLTGRKPVKTLIRLSVLLGC